MRKFLAFIATIIAHGSLLNVAKPTESLLLYDGGKLYNTDIISQVSNSRDDTSILPSSLKEAPSLNDGRLIQQLVDGVELENVVGSLRKQDLRKQPVTNGYQPSACQLVQIVHLLQHPGCQSKAVASYACSGSCSSFVRTSTTSFWQHVRSCSCCQQTGSKEATFALDCPSLDPPYRKVKTYAPTGCLCRSCTDLSREDLRPQELVEALAGELSKGN